MNRLTKIRIFCTACLSLLIMTLSFDLVKAQSPEVTREDIVFESEGVTLAGTVHTPRKAHAAVVLVHGSGQAPRMEEFASRLAQRGISVLSYDKRGVGQSGGVYAGPEVGTNNVDQSNLILLAKDASAAVTVLHERSKDLPVGLVGISQAGWIIPIAATQNPLVDFMVIFSGSMVSAADQLIFQHYTDGDDEFWDTHTEEQVREYIPMGRQYLRNLPEFEHFVDTDPRDALGTLSVPGLWVFGAKDIQVPVGLSVEYLNTLKAQGKPYEYCIFYTLGHNVVYADTTEPVDIAVCWIKGRNRYINLKEVKP